jgi:hypothetical protein
VLLRAVPGHHGKPELVRVASTETNAYLNYVKAQIFTPLNLIEGVLRAGVVAACSERMEAR